MSVLKNLAIDLPQSERKTLGRFLALYIFFIVVILTMSIYLYYSMQKEINIQERTISLNQYANELIVKLKDLQNDKTNTLLYPIDKRFKSSLYDKDYNLIYSTMLHPKARLDEVIFTNDVIVRYIKNPDEYYINTQYVVVKILNNQAWFNTLLKTIFIYGSIFFVFSILIGYFLVKLLLKPMKETLHLLDRFIKDTTHELNTPVSTIMTNVELIQMENIKDIYLQKIISRIDIASKTISNIYDDLTYLILNNKILSHDENVDLKKLLIQRIEYFESSLNIKNIRISYDLEENVIFKIDRKKIAKLIDNILSNAIKYNKMNGNIFIKLEKNSLSIKDSGKGIEEKYINKLFHRYTRFDDSVGGFGIGLNIVKLIANEYKLKIKVDSKKGEFTKFSISW